MCTYTKDVIMHLVGNANNQWVIIKSRDTLNNNIIMLLRNIKCL